AVADCLANTKVPPGSQSAKNPTPAVPAALPVGSWSAWVPDRDHPVWSGRVVFNTDKSVHWDEPNRRPGVKHPGRWWQDGPVLKFQFSDDKEQGFNPPRTWVVKDLKYIMHGYIEPEGKAGFFELEKQD